MERSRDSTREEALQGRRKGGRLSSCRHRQAGRRRQRRRQQRRGRKAADRGPHLYITPQRQARVNWMSSMITNRTAAGPRACALTQRQGGGCGVAAAEDQCTRGAASPGLLACEYGADGILHRPSRALRLQRSNEPVPPRRHLPWPSGSGSGGDGATAHVCSRSATGAVCQSVGAKQSTGSGGAARGQAANPHELAVLRPLLVPTAASKGLREQSDRFRLGSVGTGSV